MEILGWKKKKKRKGESERNKRDGATERRQERENREEQSREIVETGRGDNVNHSCLSIGLLVIAILFMFPRLLAARDPEQTMSPK